MRRMTREICATTLAALLAVTGLAGCGKQDQDSTTPQNSGQPGEVATGGEEPNSSQNETPDAGDVWSGEVDKIVMTFLTAGVEPADLGIVQDAINEITTKKIGVEIEFKPVSIFEAPSTVPMWIGGGEQLDLFCAAFTGVDPFIALNMIEPMTDLLEQNAPYLEEFSEESPVYYEKNGEVYGIRVTADAGIGSGGYLFVKEALEAADFTYEDGDVITLDDLDVIDDGVSGVSFQRPGVRSLLEEVRRHKVCCIVVKDLSRFGRNYIEVGDYIEQIFPFVGVRFISVVDHFDSFRDAAGIDIGFLCLRRRETPHQ